MRTFFILFYFRFDIIRDEYQVFYRDDNQTAENAISVAYVGPSITPFDYVNPGFRLYHVDAETFEVVDSVTYIADLDQADTWVTGPVSFHVYLFIYFWALYIK